MWHLPTLSTSSVSLGTSNNANSGTSTSSSTGTGSSQQSDPLSTNPTSSTNNQIVPETMQTSVKDEFNHTVTSNYATAAAAADYSLQNLDNYYTKTSEEVPKSNSATEEQQQNNSNNTGYLSTDCTFLYAVVMSHEDIS